MLHSVFFNVWCSYFPDLLLYEQPVRCLDVWGHEAIFYPGPHNRAHQVIDLLQWSGGFQGAEELYALAGCKKLDGQH